LAFAVRDRWQAALEMSRDESVLVNFSLLYCILPLARSPVYLLPSTRSSFFTLWGESPYCVMAADVESGKADEEAQKLERRRALRDLNGAPQASMRETFP